MGISMEMILFGLSTVFGVAAYAVYFQDTRKSTIRPNRWSWLIWAFTVTVEVATFHAISDDVMTSAVFYVSAIACAVVTVLIWRKSKWERPSWTEIVCVLLNIAAIIVWLVFHQEWWAHVIALVAVPISFIPTYAHAWKDWSRENSPSWVLWTIGDVLAFFYVADRMQSVEELPYAAIEAISHAAMWLIVSWRARGAGMHRIKQTEQWLKDTGQSLINFAIGTILVTICANQLLESVRLIFVAGIVIGLAIITLAGRSLKRQFSTR